VHSSTLVTAGIYLIIRFYRALGPIKFWVLPLSLITILLAGLVACVESDLKKIIAMSTLSQLGVILFSLNIINWKLAFFHILTHAMFKSMLFLGGGNMIIINWGDQNSHTYGGIYSPSLGVFNIIGSLSLIGFPFLSGFYSKDIIIELSFLRGNTLTVCVFLFRCIITVLYSLRFIAVGFFLYSNNFNTFNYNIPYNIIIPIFFLCFWVLIGGALITWVIIDECFYFMFLEKLIGIIILILGFLFFYARPFREHNLMSYLGNNIFISWISTRIFNKTLIKINILLKRETAWLEILGPKGLQYSIIGINTNLPSSLKLVFLSIFSCAIYI